MMTTLPRYIIYSFHMPLFMGLGGYLFNFDKFIIAPKNGILSIIKKILIPWFIASTLYFIYNHFSILSELSIIKFPIRIFLNTYYHLWYIPSYILFISIIVLFIKNRIPLLLQLLLVILITGVVYYIFKNIIPDSSKLQNLLNTFRIYNLIFFFIGYVIRTKLYYIKINYFSPFICLILYILLISIGYTQQIFIPYFYFYYIANIYGIFYFISLCNKYPNTTIPIISDTLGKYSLYFYLYHVFILNLKISYFNRVLVFLFITILIFNSKNILRIITNKKTL